MKYLKKTAAVIGCGACAALLALSLVGCGGTSSDNGAPDQNAGSEQGVVADPDNLDQVKVNSAELSHDAKGNHVFIPVVEWTNSSDAPVSFNSKYTVSITCDGKEAKPAEAEIAPEYDGAQEIEPGAEQSVKVSFAYDLEKSVKVVVANADSGDEVASVDFTINTEGHEDEKK